jgi:hypothetical protein
VPPFPIQYNVQPTVGENEKKWMTFVVTAGQRKQFHKRKEGRMKPCALSAGDADSQACELQMSSFEKVVKNACKPKPAPPKSKVSTSRCCYPASLPYPSFNSTSTPSLQPHGLTTVLSMTSAEPSLPVFGSQIPSSVLSSREPSNLPVG